jgi:acyl dehydratase
MTVECVAPPAGESIPARTIGPFSAQDLGRYAEASGDSNPLHLDPGFAGKFGFSACPVHGMRLLAAFEPLLAEWRPDLAVIDLRGQFLKPILEGETALLTTRIAKVETSGDGFVAVARLMAQTISGAPALLGEARLVPARR